MALTIHGSAQSRTMRVLWAAQELGIAFEHVPTAWNAPELKQPPFLRTSPSGRIPAIVDDGFALHESLAIVMYLAKSRGSPLYPDTVQGEALTWSWTLWATFELEAPLEGFRRHGPTPSVLSLPEAERIPAVAEEAGARIEAALAVLDRTLADRPYLLGESFTVADLNLACVLSPSRLSVLDLQPFANVRDWLGRCHSRPAWLASRGADPAG